MMIIITQVGSCGEIGKSGCRVLAVGRIGKGVGLGRLNHATLYRTPGRVITGMDGSLRTGWATVRLLM